MKITKINKIIKCDTILCNKNASYQISTNSFKGDYFICENCYSEYQKLFKRINLKDEQPKE